MSALQNNAKFFKFDIKNASLATLTSSFLTTAMVRSPLTYYSIDRLVSARSSNILPCCAGSADSSWRYFLLT